MLKEYVCRECGKRYFADIELGTWQKDNSQKRTFNGVSVKNFCCYECGKLNRKKSIQTTFKHMSIEEKDRRRKIRQNKTKTACCSVCGKEFIINSSANTDTCFCSNKCRMIHKYNLPLSGYRKCEECGKEYYYEQGMGNWNAKNEKVWSTNKQKGGKGRENTVLSHKYCCYECGIKHKEKLRAKTNLKKYGKVSPFQDTSFMVNLHNKQIENGTLFTSKGELEVKSFIESLGFKTKKIILGAGNSKDKPRLEIDIFIPDKNIGIEYNGSWFHSMNGKKENKINKSYHFQKSKLAESYGYELIHVWEDQWLNQKSIIKDILRTRLSATNKTNKIFARQCTIKYISNDEYKQFCNSEHIQGYHKASIKLGLYHNDKLVQIASFSKCRNLGKAKENHYGWEWIRGCVASNNKVIGGASKLFKYFVTKYNPNSVLCYADWNLFNGKGYEKCNFKFDGYTGPDKFYITAHNTKRINRSPYKYKEYKQLVEQKKLLECYGAGSKRYVWKKEW